ncbi:carbohydrate ABC transporter permease [Granulosicoccus antarcticus]|uniref:Maltose/maltodextrin transport system permease protein MalG n=1 Tax=Granulosicoccus antarcticus IMCC3135 TaxID=1192854 RepID=A0A2Z2P1E9_9GAMM|nr:carbohydrate ABC transporter permease [Granulosicoccus antarcticus]ASJ73394.1 Inner membrane ABC transporter permease protein YcjP [Granulosicoccus antarcticus IMCC3135]
MHSNFKSWPVIVILTVVSLPLLIMFVFQIVDTFTNPYPGSIWPQTFTLEHWRFLWEKPDTGRANIWAVTWNTFVFAGATAIAVTSISLTAAYALSRLNFPARRFFLAGLIVLHAFPTITLIIAIFLILQYLGLYDSLIGVILVKSALELPFGIWIMKGFYDTVPWEIEMAGVQDGASRLTVWWKLVLPQVQPGLSALLIFSFLSGWSEFILPLVLAPGNEAQVLSTYLSALILDDTKPDFNLFKSVGMFYAIPVIVIYLIFQNKLMNIYGGGSKG